MRVGYVLNKFPKLSETFVLHEMLELERQGVDLEIFSLGLPDEGRFHRGVVDLQARTHNLVRARRELARGFEAAHTLQPEWPNTVAEAIQELLREGYRDPLRIVQQGLDLALREESHAVDCLHAHFLNDSARVASVASRLLGIPYSVTCHAKDIYHESALPIAVRRLAGQARFLVTVCDANRRHLLQVLDGQSTPVHRIYNGIDLDAFRPAVRDTSEPPRIIGVGRMVEKKGFDVLIDACALLRDRGVDFECILIGEGRERPGLEQRAMALGLERVRFLGALTQEQTRDWTTRSSVLALPCVIASDGNRDALPTVLLEAMALGVPFVSTDVVGIPEIAGDELAECLVPQRDAVTLADRVQTTLEHSDRAGELGRLGRQRAERLFSRVKNVTLLKGRLESTSELARAAS